MDAYDIFRLLRTGAKFDAKRLQNGASRFKRLSSSTRRPRRSPEALPASEFVPEEPEDQKDSDGGITLLASQLKAKRTKKTVKTKKQLKSKHRQLLKLVKRRRKLHQIEVEGGDVPEPIDEFSELVTKHNIGQDIVDNIIKAGFKTPTPIQMQTIPVMLQRREILGCAPTGSGKTAAFLIPIIHQLKQPMNRGFRAVIMEPTRELANQVYQECLRLSWGRHLHIHLIDKVKNAEKKFGPNTSQRFDILISTPNRLVHLLEGDCPKIRLKNVEWLIVDESDKLFEEGKRGFRDQLAVIYKACENPRLRHGMFSATFVVDVCEWCQANLDNCVTVSIGKRNTAVDTVHQELVFCGDESGKLVELRNMVRAGVTPPVLVFVQTKERAGELFAELIYDGINVEVMHADRSQIERDNIVKAFRAGRIWVLICTDLMGRGIDFKGVNLVINYDLPSSTISYIHRIGRTGRAGREGKAVTFYTFEDVSRMRGIAMVAKKGNCAVPRFLLKAKRMSWPQQKKAMHRVPRRDCISTAPLARPTERHVASWTKGNRKRKRREKTKPKTQ